MARKGPSRLPALRTQHVQRRSDLPAPGEAPPDEPAHPITYEGVADGDPTWATLPAEVLALVDRNRLAAGRESASFVAPERERRGNDGSVRRSILAWRLNDADELVVIEASMPVDEKKPMWRVRVATVSDVAVQRASMAPVAVAAPGSPGQPAAAAPAPPPTPPDYFGGLPEIWANLPARVRQAVDAAVALRQTRDENGAARLWYQPTPAGIHVSEKVWYARRGTEHVMTGVFTQRNGPSAVASADTDSLRAAVSETPWEVIAFRARVVWKGAPRLDKKHKSLPKGGPKELDAGLRRRELGVGSGEPRGDATGEGEHSEGTGGVGNRLLGRLKRR